MEERQLKSGDKLYQMSEVRRATDDLELESDLNPYTPLEIPDNSAPSSSKIRVVPMLMLVIVGMVLGQYLIPLESLPASAHVLQHFRRAAIGGLLGVLMYAMLEYFLARRNS